ncbi:TlyA family RNA methyltransferase [Variovorax sp.]|uniref:TlyA family RNA methyltransferase n=1 Tax=Variovorax sp. TaxID=1871043 RepID=UPI002D737C88|nr:TlyA family RNA methyltransferase [Variovorax sp.]HYP83263.1 TlyA family RNA methyltransferase [Variovorax sp.]
MRADQLLVERGLAASRSQAARLLAAGMRWRAGGSPADAPWRTVGKSGEDLPPGAEIELIDAAEARYVSRGGLKLEGALRASGVDPAGRRCLDVGQSTGGFTDCLLQHGAAQVVGIDVGHGQLHARLRADARVRPVEKVNARALCRDDLLAAGDDAGPFGLIVGDLSFISLTLVLPALVPWLAPQGDLLMLVKPQFELQPGQIGKGGIVRDPAFYREVEARLRDACAGLGLALAGWFDSPIAGGDGNREFFVHAVREDGRNETR